jgi:hypothetical protein
LSICIDRQVTRHRFAGGSSSRGHRAQQGNGDIDVDAELFSESAARKIKQENLQSFLVLNKFGDVIMGEKSKAVSACLAR